MSLVPERSRRAWTRLFPPVLLGVVFFLVCLIPLHEFGHWSVATMDGARIDSVAWFPYIDETGLHNPNVVADDSVFSSTLVLVLFRSAGLLITFIPFLLLFVYLYNRKSVWWIFAFIQVMLSPVVADLDMLDIGRILQNPGLGVSLRILSYVVTIVLYVWFVLRIWQLAKTQKS
jgi:hypothetical protein